VRARGRQGRTDGNERKGRRGIDIKLHNRTHKAQDNDRDEGAVTLTTFKNS